MKIIKITPQGFCVGVIKALSIAVNAAKDKSLPKPIYIIGNIVHNRFVSNALKSYGLITVEDKEKSRTELLENIEWGTVIFTAHGVSTEAIEIARKKGLYIINATCKYVNKTNIHIKNKLDHGYDVIYIGKRNHPEPEGAISINPDRVHLVENEDDIEKINVSNPKIIVTNQTTMSFRDIKLFAKKIRKTYPNAEFLSEICKATLLRQEAVAKKAMEAELTIVVGDRLSNNTNNLVKISESVAMTPAYRVENINDINPEWFKDCKTVAVTSGASTPTAITEEVIEFLKAFDYGDKKTHRKESTINIKNLLP